MNISSYRQEPENFGYPISSWSAQCTGLVDLLKSMTLDATEAPIDDFKSSPQILPSRIFQFASKKSEVSRINKRLRTLQRKKRLAKTEYEKWLIDRDIMLLREQRDRIGSEKDHTGIPEGILQRDQLYNISKLLGKDSFLLESKAPGTKDFDFSSVQIPISDPLVDEILEWSSKNISEEDLYKEGDEYGREDYLHITVFYGIHSENPNEAIKLLSKEKSFKIKLDKISFFESDEQPYDVLKIDIKSSDLLRINEFLRKNIKESTVTFQDYKPHLTLAYLKKGLGKKFDGNADLKGKEFEVEVLEFSSKKREIGGIPIKLLSISNKLKGLKSFKICLKDFLTKLGIQSSDESLEKGKAYINQKRKELKKDFEDRKSEFERWMRLFESDQRYSVLGKYPLRFEDKPVSLDPEAWTRKVLELEGVYDLGIPYTEKKDFDTYEMLLDSIYSVAKNAELAVNSLSMEIPSGIDTWYEKEQMVGETPRGYVGLKVEEKKSDYEGKPITSIRFITQDGTELIILEDDLRGYKPRGGKYYIPLGTLVYLEDPLGVQNPKSKKLEENEYGILIGKPYESRIGWTTQTLAHFKTLDGPEYYLPAKNLMLVQASLRCFAEVDAPNLWREHPESGDFDIETSSIGNDVPFFHERSRGAVPFLSSPNVGDVMTDRTNTRGITNDSEYLGKRDEELKKERESQIDLMKNLYQKELEIAESGGNSTILIDYLREKLSRFAAKKSDFKFDPNSTIKEGRWRLIDPKKFDEKSFKRWYKWGKIEEDGISFVVGKLKEEAIGNKSRTLAIQTIRFNKEIWSEESAAKWWENNKDKFNKEWTETDWQNFKLIAELGEPLKDNPVTIYIVRHGLTSLNEEDRLRGWLDVELSDEGKKQAKHIAKFFKDIKIDKIFSSDLIRAVQTAEPISEISKVEIQKTPNLRPINFGELQGKLIKDVEPEMEKIQEIWKNNLNEPAYNGESFLDFQNRNITIFEEILGRSKSGENIVIAAHLRNCIFFLAYILNNRKALSGETLNLLKNITQDPAGISILKYSKEKNKMQLDKENYTEHLIEKI
jgi:broad specificity phosphatase PhoE/2'-5' RNA ligase